jgi:hypothetical protein
MYRHAPIAAALAFALTALGSNPASAIDTIKAWDGVLDIQPFGCPNSTTYGQIITVENKNTLNKFIFKWLYVGASGTGSMVVRGEVYAWDGTKATGSALWESAPRTISFTDNVFHTETFKTGPLPLTPGAQYVLFASIDKDYEQCSDNYEVAWGVVPDGTYKKGFFVFQNNSGDEGNWTTQAWNGAPADLAFKAVLK